MQVFYSIRVSALDLSSLGSCVPGRKTTETVMCPSREHDKGGCLKPHHTAELVNLDHLTSWCLPSFSSFKSSFSPNAMDSIFCRGNCALYYTNILIRSLHPPALASAKMGDKGWFSSHHSSVFMCSFCCKKVFLSFILA